MRCVLALLAAAGFIYQDPAADRLIRETLGATYSLQFARARASSKLLQERHPDHPAGYNLMAETFWWEAQTDPGNEAVERAYLQANELAQQRAEAALKAGKYARSELLSGMASAHASYARFQITQKNAYLNALRAGLRARTFGDEARQLDPENPDLLVGAGAYNYFTGALPAAIRPFAIAIGLRGDKDLGRRQLQTAVERSRYANTEARIVLYTALTEDSQFQDSFPVLEKMIAEFPDNHVFFLWASDWFARQGRLADGAAYFERLYERQAKRAPVVGGYALLEKAQLQKTSKSESRATLERIKKLAPGDPLLMAKVRSLEAAVR